MKDATRRKAVRWRFVAALGAAALAVVVTGSVANATTKITVDSVAVVKHRGGIDGARSQGPGSYDAPTVAKVNVTEDFCQGAEFRVYDKESCSAKRESRLEFPPVVRALLPAIARVTSMVIRPSARASSSRPEPMHQSRTQRLVGDQHRTGAFFPMKAHRQQDDCKRTAG